MPVPLLVLWSVVTCGYLAWVADRATYFELHESNLVLFGALLACGAVSVEMARRTSEPDGVGKDVYAVWELPVVFLLPALYALIVPISRLALTQWRIKRAPLHRRVYTAATIGISYGCARLVFMALIPIQHHTKDSLIEHAGLWLVAAGVGALTQWVVNQVLILSAYKLDNPHDRVMDTLFARESLQNDATEMCAALLVAVGMTISCWILLVALPLGTLLQRSFRHTSLLNEARADAKTGLLNAAAWERMATVEVTRAVRTCTPLAVALLDLDRFKQINDTHGHLVGDEVLRRIAETMTEVLREYDLAGRFGGEEFVMLLPQTRATDAFKIANRVRAHIARMPIALGSGEQVQVTVSIGVAALDAGSNRELTDLLAAADAALYRAKASGRDQVQMISTSRGLSAVSPPDVNDSAADSDLLWQHGTGAQPAANPQVAGGASADGTLGGELLVPGAGLQPAVDGGGDDGSTSTATTSAIAV